MRGLRDGQTRGERPSAGNRLEAEVPTTILRSKGPQCGVSLPQFSSKRLELFLGVSPSRYFMKEVVPKRFRTCGTGFGNSHSIALRPTRPSFATGLKAPLIFFIGSAGRNSALVYDRRFLLATSSNTTCYDQGLASFGINSVLIVQGIIGAQNCKLKRLHLERT